MLERRYEVRRDMAWRQATGEPPAETAGPAADPQARDRELLVPLWRLLLVVAIDAAGITIYVWHRGRDAVPRRLNLRVPHYDLARRKSVAILFISMLAEVALLLWLLSTGRGAALIAMGGLGVLTVVLLIVAWLVVTSREQVANTLNELAATMEKNDVNAVLEYISPSATALRGQAQRSCRT